MARGSGRGWQGYPDSRLVVVCEDATVDIFTARGRIYAARARQDDWSCRASNPDRAASHDVD